MRRGSSAVRCPIILKDCTDKERIINSLKSLGGVERATRSACTEENHFCIEEIAFFRRRPGKDESVGSEIQSAGKQESCAWHVEVFNLHPILHFLCLLAQW